MHPWCGGYGLKKDNGQVRQSECVIKWAAGKAGGTNIGIFSPSDGVFGDRRRKIAAVSPLLASVARRESRGSD
jgi:hypothetical protein